MRGTRTPRWFSTEAAPSPQSHRPSQAARAISPPADPGARTPAASAPSSGARAPAREPPPRGNPPAPRRSSWRSRRRTRRPAVGRPPGARRDRPLTRERLLGLEPREPADSAPPPRASRCPDPPPSCGGNIATARSARPSMTTSTTARDASALAPRSASANSQTSAGGSRRSAPSSAPPLPAAGDPEHGRPGRERLGCRGVRRAVVHDDDLGRPRAGDGLHGSRDRGLLVARGYQGDDPRTLRCHGAGVMGPVSWGGWKEPRGARLHAVVAARPRYYRRTQSEGHG